MAASAAKSGDVSGRAGVALASMRRGQEGVIRYADLGKGDVALLGAMGLRCDARVRLCRAGEPCIVAVCTGGRSECRIGLARPLAEKIMVDVTTSAGRSSGAGG